MTAIELLTELKKQPLSLLNSIEVPETPEGATTRHFYLVRQAAEKLARKRVYEWHDYPIRSNYTVKCQLEYDRAPIEQIPSSSSLDTNSYQQLSAIFASLAPGTNEINGMPSTWVWTNRRLGNKMSETYLVYPTKSTDNRLGAMKVYHNKNPKIVESNSDYQNSISHLRCIVNAIKIFTDADRCLDFLEIISCIHELNQVESVYIFCSDKSKHEQWSKSYEKIKGVFTEIGSVYDVLIQDIHQSEANLTSVTILAPSSNMKSHEIDPTFIYSQLLKEILIDIEKEDTEKQKLIDFCREQHPQNDSELEFINEFDRDYLKQSPL
ncbi:unnamed protein product [Rotaria sp. Silwood1]|nr:unnamed protein product [Rotaria sp. Silwood1]CAF1485830.1 unnamed protein product [Rotaria sp. Silwood1]